jgi:crotonobetainyl-CoA:carnitine CoA-transferase CaiB-like acyl-CoA transferase
MEPFAEVKVVDFSHTIAGPVCTQFLNGMGAEVIKVEPLNGESGRAWLQGAPFASFNRDKKSIAVNLKDEEGEEIVRELVGSADVVVENFRPGKLSTFGLDYESVSDENPDIVYCSLSGYGQEGPYADYPAFDPIVQAMSGLMSLTGYPEREPVRVGTSAIDAGTGIVAAFLVASGLLYREQTGEGGYLDVSLFETAIHWLSYRFANYFQTDGIPERAGAGVQGVAVTDLYHAGEDDLVLISATNDELYKRLCRAIDREDLIIDERFSDTANRWENRSALREELEQEFTAYNGTDLQELLISHGVPAGRVQDIDAVAEDPHVAAQNLLVPSHNPTTDTDVQVARVPFRVNGSHPTGMTDPPRIGEHTEQVLSQLGYSADKIDRLLGESVVTKEDK